MKPRTLFKGMVAGAVVLSGVALLHRADAAYSGLVTRGSCGSAIFVDTTVGWSTDPADGACWVFWNDPLKPGTGIYNTPVERRSSDTTMTTSLSVFGSADAKLGRVCMKTRTYGPDGKVAFTSSTICTTGASAKQQDITTASMSLKKEGAANVVVTATAPAAVYAVRWTYTSNGD